LKDNLKDEALNEIRKGLVQDPKNKELQLKMGQIYKTMGNYEKATHYFLRTRRYHPESTESLIEAVNIFLAQSKEKEALQTLNDLSKKHPAQKDLHIVKSYYYEKTDNLEVAVEELNKYLESDEENVNILSKILTIHEKLKQTDKIIDTIKKMIAINPTAPLYAKMALCYLKHNKLKTAEKYYKEALKLNQNNTTWHYNLGFIYEKQSDIDIAIKHYQKAYAIDNKNGAAKEALVRFKKM